MDSGLLVSWSTRSTRSTSVCGWTFSSSTFARRSKANIGDLPLRLAMDELWRMFETLGVASRAHEVAMVMPRFHDWYRGMHRRLGWWWLGSGGATSGGASGGRSEARPAEADARPAR